MKSPPKACHTGGMGEVEDDSEVLEVEQRAEGARFRVRVAPRASRAAVLGVHAGALKVSLTAPPVDGAANAALVKLLAKRLGVARGRVAIVSGERSRDKTVEVEGLDAGAVRALAEVSTH